MLAKYKKGIWVGMLVSLFLTACGGKQTPTLNAELIYTSAAQTVQAALTQQATPQPPTSTQPPPATNTPAAPTAVILDTSLTPTQSLPQPPTATLPVARAADQAEWISNTPPDDALVYTNAKFDVVWTVKNTGQTTWKTTYKYAVYAGDIIVEKRSFNFRTEVKPGETGTFIIDAVAPSKPGTYTTWWKLINDQGQNFGDMSLRIIVVKSDTTPTPSPTANAAVPTEEPTVTPE